MEHEIKLEAPEGFVLPDLTPALSGVEVRPREVERYTTIYVDTADLRLARWGCSLRHRTGQGWTVKLPPVSDDEALVRPEHRSPGDADEIPPPTLDLITSFTRGAQLGPVARLAATRRSVELSDGEGRRLGEVVDDDVAVEMPEARPRFRQLEVEIADGAPTGLPGKLQMLLQEAGAGPVTNAPKYLLALGDDRVPGPEVPAPALGRDATVEELLRGAFAASVRRLILHDPGVRLDDDPEDVHQARVATRRLRSDIRTFRRLQDASAARTLLDELAWIGTTLGAVRDADVMLHRLRPRLDSLREDDTKAATALLGRLEGSRRDRRAQLVDALRQARYTELLDRLVGLAASPRLADGAAAATTDDLHALMKGRWRRLTASVAGLGDDASDEALHAARIQAKRARYAAEAMAPVFGKPARAFARAAAHLQDVLGEHHDAVATEAWLREAAGKAGGRQAFVAGQLAAVERRAAELARASWPAAWNVLDRKRLRFWT
jgi:CHAD domain-containing protein